MKSQPRDSYLRQDPSATRFRNAAERLVFVDIETAGQQVWRPIIQIAAIAVDSAFREVESFEEKIQFDESQAVRRSLCNRHYSRRRWRIEARRDKDVAVDFSAFLTRHATVGALSARGRPFAVAQLVAHNASFDAPFLRAWFERLGLFFPGTYRVFCTLHRAMWLFHEDQSLALPEDFKLGTLCRYFGVELRPDEAHDALADARATVQLYRAMQGHTRQRRLANVGKQPKRIAAVQKSPAR